MEFNIILTSFRFLNLRMVNKINLINANFITLDKECPNAESISIIDNKIAAINSIDTKFKSIDLKGATVIPGFVDSHFHLTNLGKQLDTLHLKECKSAAEIAKKVLKKSKTIGKDEWILGFGWDQTKWDMNKFPLSYILNDLPISQPVMLTRIDGHSCWVNKHAMFLSGLDVSSASIEGGEIINNCILIDNAMNPVQFIVPKQNEKSIEKWIKLALKIVVSKGITNVHDAWQDPIIVKVLKKLENEKKLPIRVYGMLGSSHTKFLKLFLNEGIFKSNHYTIRSVKAFIDGALGSRGASLLEPYSDQKNNCGLILISEDEYNKIAQLCAKAGFQLCTHAIGDRGNRIVLDVYSNHNKNIKNHRWRIEHAQMVSDEDIPRFINNGIIPSMQPSHCTSDMRWLNDRIGKLRLNRISRWKSFIDQGCKIAGGSDCPIEEGNPIFEYYAAVTRKNHDGYPKKGWQPQEIISRIDALKMFTTWAAYAEFSEHRRGKIRPGFDADLSFLSNNILTCSDKEILEIQILGTMVSGNFVYNNFI